MLRIFEINDNTRCSTEDIRNLAVDLEYLNPKIGSLANVKNIFLGKCHCSYAYYRFLESNENYGIHELIAAIKNELAILLTKEPYYVCFANKPSVTNDYFIMSTIAKVNGLQAAIYASEDLKHNIDFAKIVVSNYGLGLSHFPEEIRDHKDIAIAAVSQNTEAFEFVSEYLKHDIDVVTIAAQNGMRMSRIPLDCQTYEVVKASVIWCGENIHNIKNSFKHNPEIIFLASINGGSKSRISQIPMQCCLPNY